MSVLALAALLGSSSAALAATAPAPPALETGGALLRVLGAMVLVLSLFGAGVWLFRNWQRVTLSHGRTPRLNVVESRSLGPRHALYVVAYDQQRLLLSASPTGVSLIAHLPEASPDEPPPAPPTPFVDVLRQALQPRRG